MKPETQTKDILATLATVKAANIEASARRNLDTAIDRGGNAPEALERVLAARAARLQTDATLKRVPAPRRDLAARTIKRAEEIGHEAARACGSEYSGDTSYHVAWGTRAEASTGTSKGKPYSRCCTYKKTDADHLVILDPAGASLLVENEPLRLASIRDGLHLIAIYPDSSAVWVEPHGKAIISERGWIVGNGALCYHSTESLEHAQKGMARKQAAHLKELRERRLSQKEARRAALVARLCNGASATLEDAKDLGYCEPGIRAFQARHGIADTATLPQLIKTGDPSAVRLAMKIARSVKRQPVTA